MEYNFVNIFYIIKEYYLCAVYYFNGKLCLLILWYSLVPSNKFKKKTYISCVPDNEMIT